MDTIEKSTKCLICFQITTRKIFVPADASGEILKNCKTYLHSTLTKKILKDTQLKTTHQFPLCKSCFDSALELTQLSEQLETVQKEISDLTIAFSLAIFHRRSQVYNSQTQNNSQSVNKSSNIELNVSCLPSNTFWTEDESQNIQKLNDKDNQNIISDNTIGITDVKYEILDYQLDNLPRDCQETDASDDAKILLNEENEDKNCNQHAVKNPTNPESQSKVKTIQTNVENESIDSGNFKNVRQLTMADLMKTVRMPQVKLKRINITGLKENASSVNSSPKTSEPIRQLHNNIIKYKDNDFSNSNSASYDSVHSVARKRLKCFYCEKTFKRANHRNDHHRIHTGEKPHKCVICAKGFVQISNLKSHERIHTTEKHFECHFCKERFSTRTSQKIHERTHTAEKPFKCSFCEKRFLWETWLRKHERRIHNSEIPCNVPLCKEKFAQIGNMIIQGSGNTHSGEKKRFKCSFCEQRYTTLVGVKNHEKYHAGERPFQCSFCEKRFCFKNVLQLHERTHGEKPYECSFCKKRFFREDGLKIHERTHRERPYECSLCKKRFSKVNGLKMHEITHTGEKPYKCEYCEKTFNKLGNKDRHQTVHRKNTLSLICSVCKQRFDSLDRLKDHAKIHADEDEGVNFTK